MSLKGWLLLTGIGVCAQSILAQGARLPPRAFAMPRTRAEWLAVTEEQDRVSKERGPHFKDAYPEYAAQWEALHERFGAAPGEYASDGVTYDTALAARLICELYTDYESPYLNAGTADYVGDILREIARWPRERLPDDARQVLSAGLREFLGKGGGRCQPWQEASMASALDSLAPDDRDAQADVEALLSDALDWAVAVQDEINLQEVEKLCSAHWGDARTELRRYESETRDELPSGPRPAPYENAAGTLGALLADPPVDRARLLEAVEYATTGALIDLDNPRLTQDLVSRLLITYRALLQRRPEIPLRVAYFIENQLLRLAVRDGLKSDRHWGLWSAAVRELGPDRISRRLKGYVRAQLEKKKLPEAQRRALENLRALAASQ
jgi:hypothetical protein